MIAYKRNLVGEDDPYEACPHCKGVGCDFCGGSGQIPYAADGIYCVICGGVVDNTRDDAPLCTRCWTEEAESRGVGQ